MHCETGQEYLVQYEKIVYMRSIYKTVHDNQSLVTAEDTAASKELAVVE